MKAEAACSCRRLQLLVFKLLKRLHEVEVDSAGVFNRSEQVQESSLDTLVVFSGSQRRWRPGRGPPPPLCDVSLMSGSGPVADIWDLCVFPNGSIWHNEPDFPPSGA